MADGQMEAIRITNSNIQSTSSSMYYPVLDHLGSMAAVVDGNQYNADGTSNPNYGQVIDRYSRVYPPAALCAGRGDPWGMARNATKWTPLDCTKGPQSPFARGFTGQEHLPDNVCLINFNARLYDPQIARFVSADPTVEAVYDGQDLNRYSYVGNDPLSLTDPTGLCFMGCFYKSPVFGAALDVGLFFFGLPELEVLSTWVTAATGATAFAAVQGAGAGMLVMNAGIAGGLSGAVTSGRLKGALLGAAQGMAQAGVTPGLTQAFGTAVASSTAVEFVAHGFVGGLFSINQKGGFVSGFLAAGVGSLPAPIPLDRYSTGIEMAATPLMGGAPA